MWWTVNGAHACLNSYVNCEVGYRVFILAIQNKNIFSSTSPGKFKRWLIQGSPAKVAIETWRIEVLINFNNFYLEPEIVDIFREPNCCFVKWSNLFPVNLISILGKIINISIPSLFLLNCSGSIYSERNNRQTLSGWIFLNSRQVPFPDLSKTGLLKVVLLSFVLFGFDEPLLVSILFDLVAHANADCHQRIYESQTLQYVIRNEKRWKTSRIYMVIFNYWEANWFAVKEDR